MTPPGQRLWHRAAFIRRGRFYILFLLLIHEFLFKPVQLPLNPWNYISNYFGSSFPAPLCPAHLVGVGSLYLRLLMSELGKMNKNLFPFRFSGELLSRVCADVMQVTHTFCEWTNESPRPALVPELLNL